MEGDLIQAGLKKEIANYFAKGTSSWHSFAIICVFLQVKDVP